MVACQVVPVPAGRILPHGVGMWMQCWQAVLMFSWYRPLQTYAPTTIHMQASV